MNDRAASPPADLEIRPVTPERWDDLARLFGASGAYSGCWCMWWRLTSSEFAANGNPGNRAALERLVAAGEVPGLLGYRAGEPVAWCSVGPREAFGRLQRSPLLGPLDDTPVWAIVCLFVRRAARGRGAAGAMVRGALAYAAERGARALEAYPRATGGARAADSAVFTGTPELFAAAGFREVARRKADRPIVRKDL